MSRGRKNEADKMRFLYPNDLSVFCVYILYWFLIPFTVEFIVMARFLYPTSAISVSNWMTPNATFNPTNWLLLHVLYLWVRYISNRTLGWASDLFSAGLGWKVHNRDSRKHSIRENHGEYPTEEFLLVYESQINLLFNDITGMSNPRMVVPKLSCSQLPLILVLDHFSEAVN